MSNGAALEKTSAVTASATPSTSSPDPLPKAPSAITRLRSTIADLMVAADAVSPALPAMVVNIRVAIEATKKARASANAQDRQTIDLLFHQASVAIVRAQTALLFVEKADPHALKNFTIDWK